MTERDQLYLEHILESIRRIEEYTASGRAGFDSNTIIQDAVVRNLQLIGESSKRLSEECRRAAPEAPWREIAGLRNILVHDYLGVDLERIWQIAAEDLAGLRVVIRRLVPRTLERDSRS